MSANSSIEWTDCTWNCVRGGALTSPGPRWTGNARFVPEMLDAPLRWKKPRRIFVNSMSDLFHEDVTDEQIAAVFGVMAACPQHTFQVLTKRPERMKAWFEWVAGQSAREDSVYTLLLQQACRRVPGDAWEKALRASGLESTYPECEPWPLPGVWLGVSCEDQQRADERIPLLLQTPAAVKFVSCEPLLTELDLRRYLHDAAARIGDTLRTNAERGFSDRNAQVLEARGLSWVIAGGESGPGARPCDVLWIRRIVEQCEQARVACFVKQLGANVRDRADAGYEGEADDTWPEGTAVEQLGGRDQGSPIRVRLRNRKGGDMSEFPEELRVRQFPEVRS
jgi:protein gp37